MLKKHKFLSWLLVFCLCLSITVPTLAADIAEKEYTIDEAYEYPVLPGTDEWKELRTQVDKIAVCQIPEEILTNMTTEALLETVLNYPLKSNMYMYDNLSIGYDKLKNQFNGLKELESREDAIEVLSNYYSVSKHLGDKDLTLKDAFGNRLYQFLCYNDINSNIIPRYTISTYTTPGGYEAEVYLNMEYKDLGTTLEEQQKADKENDELYPSAKRIAGYSPSYNCASYAFISTSPNNFRYLTISGTYTFLKDKSYKKVDSVYPGDILVYGGYDLAEHFAITKTIYIDEPSKVVAKWGAGGAVWESYYFDCPYYYEVDCKMDVYRLTK